MKKILLLIAAAMFGCTSAFDSHNTHTLTIADESVTCRVGDQIVIELESNPTTGFYWRPVEYDDMVLRIYSRDHKPAHMLAGSGGITRIRFQAVDMGESEIRLQYERPWESAAPINEVKFKVRVTH